MSPLGVYPDQSIIFRDVAFIVNDDLCFSIVRIARSGSLSPCPVKIQTIRNLITRFSNLPDFKYLISPATPAAEAGSQNQSDLAAAGMAARGTLLGPAIAACAPLSFGAGTETAGRAEMPRCHQSPDSQRVAAVLEALSRY